MPGNWFYDELAAGVSFPAFGTPSASFPETMSKLKFEADGGDIEVSYDGSTVHTKIYDTAPPLDFSSVDVEKIYIRGTGTLRVHAWDPRGL